MLNTKQNHKKLIGFINLLIIFASEINNKLIIY